MRKHPAVNEKYITETTLFYDDNYIYNWSEIFLDIYDRSNGQLLYFISYDTTRWNPMGTCAYLRDGILYMGHKESPSILKCPLSLNLFLREVPKNGRDFLYYTNNLSRQIAK